MSHAPAAIKILGLDPGLRRTGWGVIAINGSRLQFVGAGCLTPKTDAPLSERLAILFDGVQAVARDHGVHEAAIEETFANQNPRSTLKLGQARGVVMVAPASLGLSVGEYPANLIKKSLTGFGHAAKGQMQHMVTSLLPGADLGKGPGAEDAADALAVAICHAHHRGAAARAASINQAIAGAR
ncbi:MAG: crossover junction endodeoxyribonuclease RuvC [Pseudomonadota bacterium]